jgi:histidinol phosphatase-like PHP family hydrolase
MKYNSNQLQKLCTPPYKADLHVHSTNSDGKATVPEMIQVGINSFGLSVMAFAEHINLGDIKAPLASYDQAMQHIRQYGLEDFFIVYAAAEINVINPNSRGRKKIHTLILGEPDELESFLATVAKNPTNISLDMICSFNLVKLLAHPHRCDLNRQTTSFDYFDGLEYSFRMVQNGRKDVYLSLTYFVNHGVPLMASSDAHKPSDLGVYTLFNSVRDLIHIREVLCSMNLHALHVFKGRNGREHSIEIPLSY